MSLQSAGLVPPTNATTREWMGGWACRAEVCARSRKSKVGRNSPWSHAARPTAAAGSTATTTAWAARRG